MALAYSEEGYANHLQSGTLPEGSDEDPEEGEADEGTVLGASDDDDDDAEEEDVGLEFREDD